jgi:hypothetical protein
VSFAEELAAEFNVPLECARQVIITTYAKYNAASEVIPDDERACAAETAAYYEGITKQAVIKCEQKALAKLRKNPLARQLIAEMGVRLPKQEFHYVEPEPEVDTDEMLRAELKITDQPRRKWSGEDTAIVLELRRRGYTVQRVSEIMRCSTKSVKKAMK